MRSSSPRNDPARTQTVRVAEAPALDPASIPPPLVEYFAGRKIRLSLASCAPQQVSRLALYQRNLLRLEDVPEQDRPKVADLIRRGGFRVVDGAFLRGDTALYVQPYEQYNAHGWDAYRQWIDQQPNPEREAEAMRDAIDGTVRHGVHVKPITQVPDSAEIRPVNP